MSSAVITHAQGITQPLEGLHGHFSDLAAKHRDANDQLRSHANDLLSSGSSDHFTGAGASAFSGLVNYYVDTSEKHMQALDSATNAVHTCHSSVTDATNTASSADLHDGLTHKVLTKVSHDDIIQHGESSIQAVINDMLATLNDMKNTAGDFFHNVFTGHFGDAAGDLGTEFKDATHLVDDVTSLLQDIGRVLGQWASAICDAVGKCLKVVGSVLWNVLDFVTGIPSMINDVKTLFDPKASLLDKVLAVGDLALNVGLDVLMVTGAGELLRGGELLVKGLIEGGKVLLKEFGELGVKDLALSVAGEGSKLLLKDVSEQGFKLFMTAANDGAKSEVKFWIKREVYQKAVEKIGQDGVDRFIKAARNGIVGAKDQQGIKWITGKAAQYELKILSKQYANWRFYGSFDEATQHIIFDEFGKALH